MSGSSAALDEVREASRRADRTRARARVLLVVLAGAVVAAVLGQRWGVWVGFGVAGVAAVGFFRGSSRLVGPSLDGVQAAPREVRRRVGRVVRRGDTPLPEDEPLAVAHACQVLHGVSSGVWTGLMLAGSQVAGFFTRSGVDVLRVGLLGLAVLLTLTFYWYSGRVRAQLHRWAPSSGL